MKKPRKAIGRLVPVLLVLGISGVAFADPQDEGAQPSPATPGSATALQEPSDPMLITPPDAKRQLSDWRQALRLVDERDTAARIARAEIERSEGLQRQTLAGTLPTIDLTGSATFNLLRNDVTVLGPTGPITATLPDSPNLTAQVSVTQALIAPRVWHAIGTAGKSVDLASLNAEDRKRQLVLLLSKAVVDVVSAEKVAERSREGLRAALVRVDLERRRVGAGAGAGLDVIRFDQEVLAARNDVVLADAEVDRTREQLGLLLGSVEPWGVADNISLESLAGSVLGTCSAATLEDRADYRALSLQRDIADRGVTDADLRYAPTANVVGTFTVANDDFASGDPIALAVRGVLSFPLWDGGERYGARRAAKAEVVQAEERIAGLDRQVKIEQLQTSRSVQVAVKSLDIARKTRDLAAETKRLTELAFDGGSGTSFDLVESSRRLREAELTVVVREVGVLEAQLTDRLALAKCSY